MSGYPPPGPSVGINQPYYATDSNNPCLPTPNVMRCPPNFQAFTYPNQTPFTSQSANMMLGNNPNSQGYCSTGGYSVPSTQLDVGGRDNLNTGGFSNAGVHPNVGGLFNSPPSFPQPSLNPAFSHIPDLNQMKSPGYEQRKFNNEPWHSPPPPPSQNQAFSFDVTDSSHMEIIPGYEHSTFNDEIVMPPSAPDWEPNVQERDSLPVLPTFTEEDVREAVIAYANDHCCYGSGVAEKMIIRSIDMMSAFHYKLETFGESRKSARRFTPYHGERLDGPKRGPAPKVWSISAEPNNYFQNSCMKIEVPHTAFAKTCHKCIGNCRVRCGECVGNGRNRCKWCTGHGRKHGQACSECSGTGFNRCDTCCGHGQVECETCDGTGRLKVFIELTVTWKNHVDDYISETSNLPKKLIHEATGQTVLEEENPRVYPIIHSADQAVCRSSQQFVKKHSTAFPNEKILKQRHCLRMVPIAEVTYEWKNKLSQFYAYGYEHKIYFDKYPQNCCCCFHCTIL